MLLSKINIKDNPLYCKSTGKVAEGIAYLNAGEIISFDCFYSSFACNPFLVYTSIRDIDFSFEVLGTGKVEIISCQKTDKDLSYNVVSSVDFSCDESESITITVPLVASSVLFAKIIATDEVSVFGGTITSKIAPYNDISLAIIFCTYKREKYVINNIQVLNKYKSIFDKKLDFFVVDNAGTLDTEQVAGAILIKNPNLGGSGGFSRGMFEAYSTGKYSHVLLMDDDIAFDQEILDRIFGFLYYVNDVDRVGLGASMLIEESPFIQHELGATFGGLRLKSLGEKVDLRDFSNIIDNGNRDNARYCAWWGCVMPVSVIRDHGLALPLFIKYDDVEYGLRSNLAWAFPSAIGVYHTSFDTKKASYLDYYISRNELIANAVTIHRWWVLQYLKTAVRVFRSIIRYRYDSAKYILEGYEDFLKGPQYFRDFSAEAFHKKLLSERVREYTFAELENMGYHPTQIDTRKWHATNQVKVVDYNDCKSSKMFATKSVLQVNLLAKTGYLTKRDIKASFSAIIRLIKLGFKSLFSYRRIDRLYKNNIQQITSFDFWQNQWKIKEK